MTTTAHTSHLPLDWPSVPQALESVLVTPKDTDYPSLRSSYMKVGRPDLVVKASSEEHVRETVRHAAAVRRETGSRVPFSIRSGGHGISGSSTNEGGLILDLSAMRRIEVIDPAQGLVQVQAGAVWGEVAAKLGPHDLVLTSGNFGDAGVGGLATAGGVGYFARSQGLTLDHVARARLVTADGTVRWVDDQHEPDLFWAIRGGATQAGVVTDLVLRATRVNSTPGDASIIVHHVQYLVDDLAEFTANWGAWMRSAPREAESFLMIQQVGSGRFVVEGRTIWAGDDRLAAQPTLTQSLDLAQVIRESSQVIPYRHLVPAMRQPHVGQQQILMRDVLVDRADATLGAAMAQAFTGEATVVGELRALGGAVADVPVADTAWAGRHQEVLAGIWARPLPTPVVDASFAPLQAIGTGTYGAYSSDTRAAAAELAWPGETGARLRSISDRVDPDRLFDAGLVLPARP